MSSPRHLNLWSLAPTLVWLGLVAAAGWIGFRAGRSHATAVPRAAHAAPLAVPATPLGASVAHPLRTERAASSEPVERIAEADDWQALHRLPDTAARDQKLADRLERLARRDAPRALALAAAENNGRLRERLREACVKGWASVAPAAAAEWVLALPPEERRTTAGALFDGAAQQPDQAVEVAARIIGTDPGYSSEYGHLAIDALGRVGAFQNAADLAARLAPTDLSLLTTAYLHWGERDPDAALSALRTLGDPGSRRSALEGIVNGWASSDPEQLAQRASALPIDERPVALSAALSRWAERDPIAATAWIEANDPGQYADDGIATVSQQSALADASPQTALHWASLIIDPAKRTTAQQSVLTRWAAREPIAARSYAESLQDPNDRAAALAVLPAAPP